MNPLKCECCDQHLSSEDQERIQREKAKLRLCWRCRMRLPAVERELEKVLGK